jgi:regulator of replication initiation timing
LAAYDTQLQELEKELEEVYKDLEQNKKSSEVIVKENKDLRYQMEAKWRE